MPQGPELRLFPLLMGLFGGLAFFLYGLQQLSGALKSVAGGRMKDILSRLTTNRFTAVLSGAFVSAVIQSSSVTTVLVVGFVTAGLMTMAQSVGVILGANIGGTVTAQIIAFDVVAYALLLVAVGFAVHFAGKREKVRQQGVILLGLGLLFYGMGIMGEAMAPLRSYPPFVAAMGSLETPWLGILAGALFTALVQSSAATTGIVIVLGSQGLLSLAAGIALVLGANIGTCVTALLAAAGKPPEALRAAVVHILFNVLGVLVWVRFIGNLAELSVWLSPSAPHLAGLERLAAETPRQIANAHTIFNVANVLLFLPLVGALAWAAERLVPDRPLRRDEWGRPRYLDPELFRTPALAVDRARLEILRMGERVRDMIERILPAVFEGEREELLEIREMDEAVDLLHGHIIRYLGRLSQEGLREEESRELMSLMEAANDLENIGDVIEVILVGQGLQRLEDGVRVSPPTRRILEEFQAVVLRTLEMALQAVGQRNLRAAEAVLAMKEEMNRRADSAVLHESRRLVAQEPRRLEAYTLEVEILRALKRVYYFSKRMARGVQAAQEAQVWVGDEGGGGER